MIEISVLLVDDEPDFLEAMSRRLVRRGLDVTTAASGPEALDILSRKGPSQIDVVILDVKMPGMDGLETLAALKSKHPTVEVIMLTGHHTVESGIEGMKHGAFDFLMKPTDMELLMGKLDEAARKKRRHETRILEAQAQLIALRRTDKQS